MAYGKKNEIKINILNYNTALIGLSGIGKTTIIKEVCERVAGEDGYLFIEAGKESGADAINNINYINCPDWGSDYDELTNSVGFNLLIEDIIENKASEYPNLKTVVIDTYDQLIDIAQNEVIRLHNKQHPDKKTMTIKSAFGGYMAGEDMADDMVLDKLWELKRVGVSFIVIGHVSQRTVTDPIDGEVYNQLTTDMSLRSFNKLKNKLHFLGVAAIHRDIEKTKNSAGKDRRVIKSEARRITFRDDNFALDAKTRFAEIVDEISFDADEFIKALEDAIKTEASKGSKSIETLEAEQKETEKLAEEKANKYSANKKSSKVDADKNEELKSIIQTKYKSLSADGKARFKELMSTLIPDGMKDVSEVPTENLEKLVTFFD